MASSCSHVWLEEMYRKHTCTKTFLYFEILFNQNWLEKGEHKMVLFPSHHETHPLQLNTTQVDDSHSLGKTHPTSTVTETDYRRLGRQTDSMNGTQSSNAFIAVLAIAPNGRNKCRQTINPPTIDGMNARYSYIEQDDHGATIELLQQLSRERPHT